MHGRVDIRTYTLAAVGYDVLHIEPGEKVTKVSLAALEIYQKRFKTSPEHEDEFKEALKFMCQMIDMKKGSADSFESRQAVKTRFYDKHFINLVIEAATIQIFIDKTVPYVGDNTHYLYRGG